MNFEHVWQTVASSVELSAVLEQLGPAILSSAGGNAVLVRVLDPSRHRVDTAASHSASAAFVGPESFPELSQVSLAELVRWCREGGAQRGSGQAGASNTVLAVFAHQLPDALVAPLVCSDGSLGAVVISAPIQKESGALIEKLRAPFAAALQNHHRLHELTRLKEAVDADKRALLTRLDRHDLSESIIGADSGLRDVAQLIEQVAPTDAPVLILGETGSGKEVVARTIHSGSPRAKGPVVRVNCGAIPSELVDSELFGHEKGSFTGAIQARQGWFERADGGTLFLDEVGELPLAAQVRLLRVLQDGILERVGGSKPIHVDVRIVAATHRDLERMAAEGSFRRDLWYRISIFPIRIPPLRERRQDIPTLATHFAARACRRLGIPPIALEHRDIAVLVAYEWPGNVRELAAVMERAAILGRGHGLSVAAALGANPLPSLPPLAKEEGTLDAAMASHIEAALKASHGRIEGPFGAAKALGINPHTLRARMRKMGIDWKRFRGAGT